MELITVVEAIEPFRNRKRNGKKLKRPAMHFFLLLLPDPIATTVPMQALQIRQETF